MEKLPSKDLYIFPAPKPGSLSVDQNVRGVGPVPNTFSFRLLQQAPHQTAGGTVRIVEFLDICGIKDDRRGLGRA